MARQVGLFTERYLIPGHRKRQNFILENRRGRGKLYVTRKILQNTPPGAPLSDLQSDRYHPPGLFCTPRKLLGPVSNNILVSLTFCAEVASGPRSSGGRHKPSPAHGMSLGHHGWSLDGGLPGHVWSRVVTCGDSSAVHVVLGGSIGLMVLTGVRICFCVLLFLRARMNGHRKARWKLLPLAHIFIMLSMMMKIGKKGISNRHYLDGSGYSRVS